MDLLERSTIVQAVITVALIGAAITLSLMGEPLPEWLDRGVMLILGVFLGAKIHVSGRQQIQRAVNEAVAAFAATLPEPTLEAATGETPAEAQPKPTKRGG